MTRIGVSRAVAGLLALPALLVPAAAAAQPAPSELKQISLEQLMTLEVTSVARREQPLFAAPSAIVVITADDIRRSGATTLADVLRTAPGLQVANIDANKWALSSRGFNGRYADKMLVLIDGRSVYTPFFSGVYWDVQDLVLADVERIEVIRGPGAALWGANAVNGVINVITRKARDTHGASFNIHTATNEHVVADARYGAGLGQDADIRVFARVQDREEGLAFAGAPAVDDWRQFRGGVRLDWGPSPDDAITLQGEGYNGSAGQAYGPGTPVPFYSAYRPSRTDVSGGHVLARWTRAFTVRSDIALQAYYDRTNRSESLSEERDTFDADFQHHVRIGRRHDAVWGIGYRTTSDHIRSGEIISFARPERRDGLFSLFGQNEVTLVPEVLRLTLGSKVEHNSYTGWEVQPDARAVWTPGRRQSVWGAMSRAVRTPSRAESDVRIDAAPFPGSNGIPIFATIYGNPDFRSEILRSHELGYRVQPGQRLSVDVAAFYNRYSDVRTFEVGTPVLQVTRTGPHVLQPLAFGNGASATTRGLEVTGRVAPLPVWSVDLSYSYLHLEVERDGATIGARSEDDSPRHAARLHSTVTAGPLEFDASAAYVGRLRSGVPDYTRIDGRVGWRLNRALTIAGGIRNVLEPAAPQFRSTLGEVPTRVPRSVYINLRVTP